MTGGEDSPLRMMPQALLPPRFFLHPQDPASMR